MKCILLFLLILSLSASAQNTASKPSQPLDSLIPIRGFCIDIPRPASLDSFIRFINEELAPRKVNTLKYVWPNPDNLYCRSYCPLHPKIHEVLFAVIDELCDAFECTAFHGGMDEVFYLGERQCPRCGGLDPSVLFAGEVRTIHDHLAQKGRELWIWGDRLLDGKTTGLGEWEASYNNTYRAIDLIPKDVTICDWHYDRPDKTAIYFAMKGLHVITCPWRISSSGVTQVDDVVRFRAESTPEMRSRFLGVLETTWSPTQSRTSHLPTA